MSNITEKATNPSPSKGNPQTQPGSKDAGTTGGRETGSRNPYKGDGRGVGSHGRGNA